jgi:hypothetical protein
MNLLKILFKNKKGSTTLSAEEPPKQQRVMIAGKLYGNLNELRVKQVSEPYLYEDIYGRVWAYEIERYPCFDSYDYLNEDRYYRWFVHREGSDIWVVYADDGTGEVTVTKNPERYQYTCRKMLQALGWIE